MVASSSLATLNWEFATRRRAGLTNQQPPSDYFKTNILVDCMSFNPIGLRAAAEMCGVDRVVFGSRLRSGSYGIQRACADRRGRADEPG